MTSISAEECVAHLRNALSNRPADPYSAEARDWYADVAGIVSAHDPMLAMHLQSTLYRVAAVDGDIVSPVSATLRQNACNSFLARARSIYTQLQLSTNTFTTRQVNQGEVHNYFEEVRLLIAGATQDVLFIDAYINSEFVTRYLPQIPVDVQIRLLTSEMQAAALHESLKLYRQQHGRTVDLRVLADKSLHDRHLVIDGRDVYQSGASFKDGAKNAPTSINQIVDVAAEMIATLEARWAKARVVI
jgi:hypothetical protein